MVKRQVLLPRRRALSIRTWFQSELPTDPPSVLLQLAFGEYTDLACAVLKKNPESRPMIVTTFFIIIIFKKVDTLRAMNIS